MLRNLLLTKYLDPVVFSPGTTRVLRKLETILYVKLNADYLFERYYQGNL